VALITDGTIRSWGQDMKNKVEKNVPVLIRDLNDVLSISAGKYYTVVVSNGGDAE
jgi:hypothetical protein